MRNHLKRLLILFLTVCLLTQQITIPLSADTAGATITFTDTKEKTGTEQQAETKLQTKTQAESKTNEQKSGEGEEDYEKDFSQKDTDQSRESSSEDGTEGNEGTQEEEKETDTDTGEGEKGTSSEKNTEGDGGDSGEKPLTTEDEEQKTPSVEEGDTTVGKKPAGQQPEAGKSESGNQPASTGTTEESPAHPEEEESVTDKDSVSDNLLRQNMLRATTRANNSFNMPKATYKTFILQGKDGKGQRLKKSGKVTLLPSREEIQKDIVAKHNDYVSFTPHWGADSSASLSSQSGSKSASFYVNDPKKAEHVGGIGQASMTPNIMGGRVFRLEASMKNNLSCMYYNVGRYYDRSSGKSYAVDMKAVLVDFTKKPKRTADVQNAIKDGALDEDGGPLFCFIGLQSIGVLTAFCDAVTVRYSFYIHGTQTPINLKGFARFGDVDAQQGIEFSQEADYFYATEAANQYLGYSQGVYTAGNKAYIYALSSAAYERNEGNAFYTLFSGTQMTLRYTFAKCSRQDDGGEKNGSDLTKYKVPFDNSDVKHYSSSASRGYIHFDAKQPYLAQPEIQKSVFNGDNIQAEIQTPHTAASNTLANIEDAYTYKIRTVCPYEDASEHHYSSWIIRDQVSPYLNVERAVVYDGTGNQASDFRIQTQVQGDGSTVVTASAANPAAQSFYEKNWYDLYITVSVKSREQLDKLRLDFAQQYRNSGSNAGRYVLTNKAVLSTGTDYTSNEVETVIPQRLTVRKVNKEGNPVKGITFGIFADPTADVSKEKPLMTAVTGEDGTANFKTLSFYNLSGRTGPYYVREISREIFENVYVLDEKWAYSFSADAGNLVVYGERADKSVSTLEDVSKILKKYTVRLRKKNKETSNFLKGAVFSLYQWSEAGNSFMKVCNLEESIDEDGQIYYRNPEDITATEDNLGRFMVKEEQAPFGCFNAGESWTFSTTDAYMEDSSNIEFLYTAPNGRKKTQTGELIYRNDLQKGILHIIKTDEKGDLVKGALFSIKAAEDIYAPWQYLEDGTVAEGQEPLVPKGMVCGYLTTGEDGTADSDPLYIGRYQVTEIGGAPEHVQSDEVYEVEFTYPEKDDVQTVKETVEAGNVTMRPAFAVGKLAERTRNPEGEEVEFDTETGRYIQTKVPGIYNAGETIRYKITVTNTGNTDLYHIRVYDTMDQQNEAGQKLSDYVDTDRSSFVIPASGSYETVKGDKITASFSGNDGKNVLLSRLAVGDSVILYYETPVQQSSANVYNLINKVLVTASYDNNEERPGQHLIPVNPEDLVNEDGESMAEDEDEIHIPGTSDTSVIKIADRTTGGIVTDGELNGTKVPGIYYENDTVRFDIHIKNTGTANLKNILVTDIMSEELKQIIDKDTATFRLEDSSGDSLEQSGQSTVILLTGSGEKISARQIDSSRIILCENVDHVTGEGTLRPGDTVTLHFYAVVKKDAANFYDLMNTAIVNAVYFTGEKDVAVPEKTDEDLIELPGAPEAKVAKIADRTTGAVLVDGRYQNEKITGSYDNGNEIVYTITVTNSGSADLYDIKVRDVMEDRLLSALVRNSIRFQDGNYTTAGGDIIKGSLKSAEVLILDRLKAGDSVNLLLRATVGKQAGDLFELENKVYVTGHYRKGNEQYQQQYEEKAEKSGHTYVLEYHANNGTVEKTVDSETPSHEGKIVHINGNPFTKKGWQFLGWNTKADGTGQDYAPGAKYTMPAQDVHLYARWGSAGSVLKKNYTYALTYHSNNPLSQSCPDSETRCAEGTIILLDENTFIYNGYRFLGWSLTPDEKEDLMQPGESYRMPKKDTHLYAQWEKEEKVTLTYHSAVPGLNQKRTDYQTPCNKGTEIIIKQNEFARKDYRFLGWSRSKDASKVDLNPEDTIRLNEDTDLYAVWEKAADGKDTFVYRLIYHGNNETDESFTDSETPCAAGTQVLIEQNRFTYTGHSFLGWNTKADGTGKTWGANDSYSMPERNVHLYAQWKKVSKYTLNYLSNYPNKSETIKDEQRTDSETPCEEQTAIRIDGCTFQCDGYSFLGWSLTPDGSGELIAPDTQYIISADTNLYAIWTNECEEYTLLYSSNIEPAILEAAPESPSPAGTPHTIINNPFTNVNAAFAGWSTDADASPDSDNLIKPGERLEQPAKDTVLYAVWKTEQLRKVYYDGNGGQAVGETESDGRVLDDETPAISGTGIRINTSPFERDGYRFLGWSTEALEPLKAKSQVPSGDMEQTDMTWEQAAAKTEIVYPGCAYSLPDNDTVFYAIWEELPETTFAGDNPSHTGDEPADSQYTPIPVTELMMDKDHVNIPGEPDLRVAKKADKTKGVTLKKGRYQGKRKPGTYYEGDLVIYKIEVSNYGTATASQVKIKEIPSSHWKETMEPKGFTASGGETLESAKGNPVTIQKKTENTLVLESLQPGDSVTLTYEAFVKADQATKDTVKNTVKITGKKYDGTPVAKTKYMKDADSIQITNDEDASQSNSANVPQTGDDNPIYLMSFMGLISLAIAAIIIIKLLRQKKGI